MPQWYIMQNLANETLVNIFKYVDFPLNVALTCKKWYNVFKDAHMD